jgi:hypothetical protein
VSTYSVEYFGPTIPEILSAVDTPLIFEKMTFSMLTEPVKTELNKIKKKQVVLYGIETRMVLFY